MKALMARDKPDPYKTGKALVPLLFSAEEMKTMCILLAKNGKEQRPFANRSILAGLLGKTVHD